MPAFADLQDAGVRLGRLLRERGTEPDTLLLPVMPNGVPVVLGVRRELAFPVSPLRVGHGTVPDPPDVRGCNVVVVDDGVESGSVARAVAGPLREAGAARIVLAVPAGPPDTLAELSAHYDEVIAVESSPQALASYFANFDTIDHERAEQLLSGIN